MTSHPVDDLPATLYRLHRPAVFAVCLANARNFHDAEDLVQVVFLKATAAWVALRSPACARAWLLQVARRTCVDYYRSRKPTEPLRAEPTDRSEPADPRVEWLHAALQRLPASQREVLALYYLDGRDCASVAQALETTAAAVRQRLVRARAALHELLREDEP